MIVRSKKGSALYTARRHKACYELTDVMGHLSFTITARCFRHNYEEVKGR